jgi:TatD DNase family protein
VRLVDSHCHLQSDRFDADVAAVVDAARRAGVERILVPGWDLASSRRALELVAPIAWLDAAVGIHPHDASRAGAGDWAEIERLAEDSRVLAIGETGLDFDRVFSPIPDQLANLRRHLRLALDTGKPAILHVRSQAGRRDAQDAMLDELDRAGIGTSVGQAIFGDRPPAVIHSFSGPLDYARMVFDLGLAISISGLAFRAGEEATAEVVATVPHDRLLIETDSPFLTPPGGPKGRNEPAAVAITAAWVAERRNAAPAERGHEATDAPDDAFIAAYDATFPRLTAPASRT